MLQDGPQRRSSAFKCSRCIPASRHLHHPKQSLPCAVAPVEALPQVQLVQKGVGHVRRGRAASQRQLHARLPQPVQDAAQQISIKF